MSILSPFTGPQYHMCQNHMLSEMCASVIHIEKCTHILLCVYMCSPEANLFMMEMNDDLLNRSINSQFLLFYLIKCDYTHL